MVIRDIRNADASSRSRVVPITIVMTINLVPVEIARGDVATRAGVATPALNYFWRKLTGGERIKQRACVRAKRAARQRREEEARGEPGAKKLKRDGQRAGNPTRGIVSPTEVALFIMRHFRRRAGAHVDVPVYKIYAPRAWMHASMSSAFSMIFRSARFFFFFSFFFYSAVFSHVAPER